MAWSGCNPLSTKDDVAAALAAEGVQRYLAGQRPVKVIYVPGRLVNIVVR